MKNGLRGPCGNLLSRGRRRKWPRWPFSADCRTAHLGRAKVGCWEGTADVATGASTAIVVVVSEETGSVSFAYGGRLERSVDVEQLRKLLRKYYAQLEEAEAYETAAVAAEATEVGGRRI